MEDFLAAGEALLERSPASAEEIGRAGHEARALVARLGEVSQVRGREPCHGVQGQRGGAGDGSPDLFASAAAHSSRPSACTPRPQLRQRVEEKNRLLRHMAAAAPGAALGLGGGTGAAAGVDLSGVTQRWDGFTSALQQVRLYPLQAEPLGGRAQAVI
jgi:hypothetical protein